MGNNDNEWRERMAQKHRELQAERRAQLAAHPRVQAMKQALKERRRAAYELTKQRCNERALERKKRELESARADRVAQDAALSAKVRPATDGGRGRKL
jgi:hypothetical protein